MEVPVFIWKPQAGFTNERTPDVAVVRLGDGYEQRQVKGINPLMDKYSLQFQGVDGLSGHRPNVVRYVDAFLKQRGGVEAFKWTPPDTGIQRLFVCRSWTITKSNTVWQLSAVFEQVPR